MFNPINCSLISAALLGSTALLSACATLEEGESNNVTDKVIGGEAEVGEPSALLLELNGQTICTATLISPRVALTAAHCIYYEGFHVPTTASVVVNGNKLESATISDYAMHKDWTGDLLAGKDIALLYLATPLSTRSIMVDRVSASDRVGQVGKIVGFGQTVSTNANSYGEKHSVSLKISGITGTNNNLLQLTSPDSTYRASCRGDSGGPFFIGEGSQRVVAGVTSYGYGVEGDPCTGDSYYVSTAYFATWINENLTGRTTGVREVGGQSGGNGPGDGGPVNNDNHNGTNPGDTTPPNDTNNGTDPGDTTPPNDTNNPDNTTPDNGDEGGAWGGNSDPYEGGTGGFGGTGGSAGGAQSCGELIECLNQCYDQNCADNCYYDATESAQYQFDDLYFCDDLNACGWDTSCLSNSCSEELSACQ